jgi:hypothetical protein
LDWRGLTLDDWEPGLQIQPELFGTDALPADSARRLWADLLPAPGFKGAAVTGRDSLGRPQLYAFGASVFVDDAFACQELEMPRPGLNGRVAKSIRARNNIVFSRSKIAAANGGSGLNVVVLAGRWNPAVVDEKEIEEARLHLVSSFASLHAGYRFKRIMIELTNKQDHRFASEVPFMRTHHQFDACRALAVVERKDIQANQGSVLAPNFFGPLPKLFLGALEQELLLSAIDGAIDEEIGRRLGLTTRSVKRRWMVVFEQVSRSLPELFPETVNSELETRGRQKRHLVLAYVRKHPEELRPFCGSESRGEP